MAKLADVAELIMGQSPPSATYNEDGDGLPFFQGKTDFGFRHPIQRLSCNGPLKVAIPGDILISVRAPVGPTNIADRDCCIGRGLGAIRPRGIDGEFLFYNLRYIEKFITSLGSGSTFQAINKNQLSSVEVNPNEFDLPEQRKIAGVLGVVQRAIEQQELLITLTTELKKALMQKLFTEGLRGEPQKQTEIGPVPESWEVTPLEKIISRKIVDGVHQTPTYISSGIRFITAKDIVENAVCFDECKYISSEKHEKLTSRFKPERGDVLLTKVGTVGNVALVDFDEEFSYFVQLALIRPNRDVVDPSFLYWSLQSDAGQLEILSNAPQSTMKFIGTQKIAKLKVSLPPISVQRDIIGSLNAVRSNEINLCRKRNGLQDLFRTLLHQLMTGQIRANDLNILDLEVKH